MAEEAKKVSEQCTDDYGLRRRLVGMLDESSNKGRTSQAISGDGISQWYEEHNENTDKSKDTPGRIKQLGAASRIILQDDAAERSLPRKMKKPKQIQSIFVPLRRSTSVEFEQPEPPPPKIGTSILLKKGWTTADTIRHEEGAYIIFAIRDFIVYLIFLAVVWIVTHGSQDLAYNYYATVISDVITKTDFKSHIGNTEIIGNFNQLHSFTQIWGFINGVLLPIFSEDKATRVLMENILVGAPVLRQIRVKNNTCSTTHMFENLYKTCYDYYSEENEYKEPFGNGSFSAWQYTPTIHSTLSSGHVGYYGGGGYLMNFTRDYDFNYASLKELEKWSWIGLGTRAIIIDFTLFTPNTNLFLVVKLMFEVLPTGGVTTRSYFTTQKFFRYVTPWDLFIMSCEIIFILYTLYYTFEEIQQVWILGEDYLGNWWNILDLVIICLSYSTIYFGVSRFYQTLKHLRSKMETIHTNSHTYFDDLLDTQTTFILSGTFLTFATWLKLFKFTSLYKSVTLIISALGKIKSELLMVIFMTCIIICGFALCGLCFFGAHVEHFQSFSQSFFSLISVIVGSLSFYGECHKAYPILAQIYFAMYILFAAMFFFSVYVALIVYGYHCADVALQQRPDSQFLSDLVWGFFTEVLVFFRQFELIKKLQKREIIAQNEADYDAFLRVLKRQGWRGLELHLFVKTYGLERGEEMRLDKMSDMYNDFCLRNQLFIEVEGHKEIYEHLDKVDKMFEFCDQAIVDIMTKVDYLANSILPADGIMISDTRFDSKS